MKATDVISVFEGIAPPSSGLASDIENQYLGFRLGDRNTEVTGVGVAWWLSTEVVEAAARKGLNLLIIHEPELFRRWESPWHSNMLPETIPANIAKMRRLIEKGAVVYTAHSNWDLQPECGMGPTVAKALGFDDLVRRDVAVGIWRMPRGTTLGALIRRVKSRLGLRKLRVQGADDMRVRTVALGFGSIGSEVEAILVNGCDAGIFGELREWPFIFARESGVGIIEMTHLVSESVGFSSVVTEMSRRLPDLRIEFLEIPFPYRIA